MIYYTWGWLRPAIDPWAGYPLTLDPYSPPPVGKFPWFGC